MSKERLLVMNGRSILEREPKTGIEWDVLSVGRAGSMRPGVYTVTAADTAKTHDGIIAHSDKKLTYQEVSKNALIKHNSEAFAQLPLAGQNVSINYTDGHATVTAIEQSRSMTR